MPTLDLPKPIVFNMLNQASDGEQLLAILNAVTSPDPVEDVTEPDEDAVEDVTEPDEDEDEPSDAELEELLPDVVDAIVEVLNLNPEGDLSDWDNIPDDGFVTL